MADTPKLKVRLKPTTGNPMVNLPAPPLPDAAANMVHKNMSDASQAPAAPLAKDVAAAVNKGIADAFAKQEKGKLKVRPKPTNMLSNMQKAAQEKAKLKVRMKPKVATDQEPPKLKVRMKPNVSQAATPSDSADVSPREWIDTSTPVEPPQKLKVRLKNKALTTPAGMSINGMIDALNSQQASAEPTQPGHDARMENTAEMVNSTVGAVMPNRAVQVLREKNNLEQTAAAAQTAEPVSQNMLNPNASNSSARVSKKPSDGKVADIVTKIARTQANKTAKAEAAEALEGLGFSKKEFKKLLDQVDHIDKTEDKVLAVLQMKGGKVLPPAPIEKVPTHEVPAEINRIKEEHKTEPLDDKIHNETKSTAEKVKPEPKATPKVARLDANTSLNGLTPEQTANTRKSDPALPTPAKSADSDADQEKAKKDQEEAERKKKEKEDADEKKKIEKKLDDITKMLGSKGIADIFAGIISCLIKKVLGALIGPVLAALPEILTMLGPIAAIAATGALVYAGTKWLLDKFGYDGSTIGGWLANQDGKQDAQNAKYQKTQGEFEASTNNKLKGTGYTLKSGTYYKGDTKVGGAMALPPEVRAKINTVSTAVKSTSTANKTVSAKSVPAPIPKSSVAAASVAQTPRRDENIIPAQAPPIINNDNRVINPPAAASGSSDGGALIKVRNDEPSVSMLVSAIFDHPVSYGAVYRM